MPTYEYACSACGNAWEEIQKITEPPVEVCPACKKATAKRQISGGNFILKGGGWYSDLYSSSPKTSASKDDSSSKSGDEGAKASKTEAKSEGSTESKKEASSTGSSAASSGATKAAE
jgi:putative FmdB family regulatory protein